MCVTVIVGQTASQFSCCFCFLSLGLVFLFANMLSDLKSLEASECVISIFYSVYLKLRSLERSQYS
jgi:hypothetical protein